MVVRFFFKNSIIIEKSESSISRGYQVMDGSRKDQESSETQSGRGSVDSLSSSEP